MTMKMKLKMKNWSQRYDINRLRTRHGHKHEAELKISVAYKNGCIAIPVLYAVRNRELTILSSRLYNKENEKIDPDISIPLINQQP